MQLTQNVTFRKTEAYRDYQRSLKYRNRIPITSKAYPDIKISRTNRMQLMHLPQKPFPSHARYSARQYATLYEDRRAHQVLYPGDGTRKLPRQKSTTPHTAIASHTIAAYVSPMVVSPITGTIVLSYLYQGSTISICFQTMLRCSTCHNLYMPRSFMQHACIPIISNAATCHNFFMLKSFRQHACSRKVCSHRLENAARRDARERRTDKIRHGGPEGALLFLCATPQVQK
jgi:hypothetical protein